MGTSTDKAQLIVAAQNLLLTTLVMNGKDILKRLKLNSCYKAC